MLSTALAVVLPTGAQAAFPGWSHYETPQLSLITDLDERDADALLSRLAYFAQAADPFLVAPAAGKNPTPPQSALKIIVFKRRKDFARVVNNRHFAAYTQPELAGTNLIVGPDGTGGHLQNTLHEYVHYRLRTHSQAYPVWYEEGLATLLSNTQFFDEATPPYAEVGRDLPRNLKRSQAEAPRMRALLRRSNFDGLDWGGMTGFYRRSAELVQYLLFDPETRTANIAALNAHLADRSKPLTELLDTNSKRLNRNVNWYVRKKRKAVTTVELSPVADLAVTRRELPASEATRLVAETARPANPRYAAGLYSELLEADPDNIDLLAALVDAQRSFEPDTAAANLARAITLAPDHPAVLMQQALTLLQECPLDATLTCLEQWREAPRYIRAALAKDPQHFNAILWLGITELYGANPGRAVDYLRIAHHRAPWSPKVNYHLGECLRLLGNPRGRAHLQQALLWANEPVVRELAQKSLALY